MGAAKSRLLFLYKVVDERSQMLYAVHMKRRYYHKIAGDIYQKRLEKGMSAGAVASALGISKAHYSYIESGQRRPSPTLAKKIGDYLGFDHMKFFEEEKNK